MTRFFKNLFGTKTTIRNDRKSGFRPGFEALEDRRLMAGNIGLNPATHVYTITGDAVLSDVATVTKIGTDLLQVTLGHRNSSGQLVPDRSEQITASLVTRIDFFGNGGNDRFTNSTDKPVRAVGQAGNDILIGGSGHDILEGGSDNDILEGGRGDDTQTGGSGSDIYRFFDDLNRHYTLGSDTVVEADGADSDVLDFSQTFQEVDVYLDEGSARMVNYNFIGFYDLQLTINNPMGNRSSTGIENVIGTPYDDTILGNKRDNRFEGRGGNDVLLGQLGDDTLLGGADRDILIGGTGRDVLDGGAGEDILIGGQTPYDIHAGFVGAARLKKLRNEWTRTDLDYTQRIRHLTGQDSGGYNSIHRDPILINSNNVTDDGETDTLQGGLDKDWFFIASVTTDTSDRNTSIGERVN